MSFILGPFRALWRGYNAALKQQPLATKCAVGFTLMTAGDVIAQFSMHCFADKGVSDNDTSSASSSLTVSIHNQQQTESSAPGPAPFVWDRRRTVTMACIGGLWHAPLFHAWYKTFDRLLPARSISTTLKKVL
jgi:hypothetical protein